MDGYVAPEFSAWQAKAAALQLKRQGRELVGPCPACGGTDRFAVKPSEGGAALIHCRGCKGFADILEKAGFAEDRPTNGTRRRIPDATHVYRRPNGTEYHAVHRRGSGRKKEIWQRPGFKGPFDPYRIDTLADLGDRPVVIVEGENCADHLAARGYFAVTWNGGTGAVLKTRWSELAGLPCILWPDADAGGYEAMAQLADVLEALGCEVRHVAVPSEVREKWDCANATDEQIADLIAGAGESRPRPSLGKDGDETFRLVPMSEFLTAPIPPVSWLVEGLLNAAGLTILTAKPKVGKSTAARALALCVARGAPFLGRATTRGSVVYCALEEDPAHVREHFLAMGARADDPLLLHVEPPRPELVAEVERAITRHAPGLVILDPLGDIVSVRDDTYLDWNRAMKSIAGLARRHRTSVLVCHHNRKSQGTDFGDEILGSTAIRGAVDTTLHISRDGEQRVIRSEQRYGDDLAPTVLRLDPHTQRIEAGESVADVAAKQMEDEIMQAIVDKREPMNKGEIERTVKGNNGHKRQALDRLLEDGRLRSWKQGNAIVFWTEDKLSPSPNP